MYNSYVKISRIILKLSSKGFYSFWFVDVLSGVRGVRCMSGRLFDFSYTNDPITIVAHPGADRATRSPERVTCSEALQ